MSDPTVLYSRSVSLKPTSERYGNVLSSPALRRTDSQIMRDALVQTNTELLLDRWPYMGNYPEETLQLASSIDPFEAATQGSVLNAQHTLSQRADAWNELPDEEKRSLWGQLTEQQQQGVLASGGTPPETDDGSWLGDILDAGAKATGFVLGGVGSVINAVPGGSQALSVLTHIGNAPLAVYRGIRQMDSWQQWVALAGGVAAIAGGIAASPFTAGGSLSLSAAGFGTLSTLGAIGLTGMAGAGVAATAVGGSQYINSVRESWDGERAFLPDAQNRAKNLLNQDDLFVIAKDVAAELDPYQLAVEFAAVGEADDPRVFESSLVRVAEMYADKDTPEFDIVMGNLLKLYAEDNFREAVKTLQQGKISIGRDVARFAQLDPDSDVYRLVSGAVDGLTIFALDPLLAASPAVKLARFASRSHYGSYKALRSAARNGAAMMVSKSDNLGWRVDLADSNKKIRAMDQQIIDAVNANDVNLMPKNMRPVWESLRTFLSAEGYLDKNFLPKTIGGKQLTLQRSHLYEWMMDASGQAHIAQGISTVPGLGFTAIKPISNAGGWGTFKKNLREYRDELIDANPNLFDDKNLTRLEEVAAKEIEQLELGLPEHTLSTPMHDGLVTIDLSEPVARQTLGAQLGRTTGTLLHVLPFSVGPKIGTFLDAVSNMAPKRGYIVLDGTEAADEITNFVNAMGMVMGVSKSSREKWVQLIAGQGDVAQRAVLIQHFYDSIFEASGFKASFRGKAMYEEFMQKFNQTYGVGGIDEIAVTTANGVQPIRSGVMPGQSKATAIAIPDVREMIQAQRLDKLLGEKVGIVNRGSPIDWYTNRIWKPSVVLRIGFIPRAIGEEALAWIARGTTGTVLAENRARKLIKMDQRDAIVDRLKHGETIEVIHDGVKKKLQTRMKIDDLTLDERRLLAGWRSPNDVRRLERIVQRRADATSPIMSAVLEYEKFLRKVLDPNHYVDGWQTSGRKRFVDDIDANHPIVANLLLGKEHSWRRLGTQGLNQRLLSHARVWHLTHADATVRQWSAGNISYNTMYQQDPALRVEMLDDGSLEVKQRVVDTHAREIYTPEQSDFAYSTHRTINEITEDEYFGEAISLVLSRVVPDTLTYENLETLQLVLSVWRDIDWATQSRYVDARYNRPDRMTDLVDKIDIDADTILDNLADAGAGAGGIYEARVFEAINTFLDLFGPNERAFVLGVLYQDQLIARLEALGQPLDKFQQRLVDTKLDIDGDLDEFANQFVFDLDDTLLNEFTTLSIRPEIKEILQRSRRSVAVDGQYVANRVPTNYRRVYVPEILDFSALRQRIEIEQDALGGATVADNAQVAMNIAEDWVDKFPEEVTNSIPSLKNWDAEGRENAVNLLANSIVEILQNQYHFASSGWLRNAGFTDPRIARAVGDILSDNQLFPIARDSYSMGYIDVPNNRLKLVGDEWEGMRVVNSQSGGSQMISWDDEIAMSLEYARGTIVPDLDETGIPMFGVSELDATQMQLSAIVQHIKQSMLERGKTVYRINPDTKVFIAKGKDGVFEQVEPSQLLSRQNREQLFVWDKETGDFINADFDNRTLFSPEHVEGKGLMYQSVTPAVMDRLDELAGFPRLVRKNVPNVDPVTGKTNDATDFVRATWSRASDVDISVAPDEVVGPKFKEPEVNTWDKVLTFGFDRVVTPMIDSFLREPMAFHYFVLAREQNMLFLRNMLDMPRLKALEKRVTTQQLQRSRNHRMDVWNDARDDYFGLHDYIHHELWTEAAADGLSVLQYLQKAPLNKRANISKRLFGEDSDNLFTDAVLTSLGAVDQWINHVDEMASINAMRNLEPFLDTAENKSMFSQYTKNMLPFWYAEENFIKRWFRTAQTQGFLGLETIRKAQLGYMGLRHAGIIRTDENGNDWVVLPGSGAVTELISRVVPGAGTVPVGVLMQTSTNSLLPGFSAQAGSPSISPFATLPLAFTSAMFPELQNFERAFAGEINVDRSLADKFFPPSVMRFQRAITSNDSDAQFASAMVDAMIMLEARGEGLSPNHTPTEKQEYLDKLRNHARIVAFSRAVLGFVSPGSPSSFVTGENAGSFGWWTGIGVNEPKDVLNAEYQRYLIQYGYEEGLAKFLEENKHADLWDITNPEAMTVSSSKTITGGRVPTTEESLQWYDSNETWAKQNPYAAAWIAPNDEDHKFSQYAYGQSIIQGLRRKFSPIEMVDELHYKNASVVYYPQKDYYDRLRIEHANDPTKLAAIDAEYDAWRTNFLAVHPVFADRQLSPDARNQRQNTLNDIRRAMTDPLTPASPAMAALGQLVRAYDQFTAALASNRLGGRSANNLAAKRQLVSDWEMWSAQWLLANPSQRSFYDSIIARELEPLVV